MILTVLDYLPITLIQFFKHFYFIFFDFNKNKNIINKDKNNNLFLLGYSCRSLFHTLLKLYKDKNENLKICTTPIHHKSFRNIIELFIKKENITILELNDDYNKIIINDSVLKNDYDLCIISHLFGQDLNIEDLYKIKEKNKKCIFIEDRVQGGIFNKIYSNNIFDISLYSTGMDKKPCGLGGGILYSKDINLYNEVKNEILNYKKETRIDRLIFLLKKIPTYFLYNVRIFILIILFIFKLLNVDIYKFGIYYRKKNPGFQHDDYNYNINNSTILSINESLKYVEDNEKLYNLKFEKYLYELKKNNLLKIIPWYNNKNLLTIYNTIYINKTENKEKIIKYFTKKFIPIIENPTYKLFTFDYPNKIKDIEFNESLLYIPVIINMTDKEIEYLCEILFNYLN